MQSSCSKRHLVVDIAISQIYEGTTVRTCDYPITDRCPEPFCELLLAVWQEECIWKAFEYGWSALLTRG